MAKVFFQVEVGSAKLDAVRLIGISLSDSLPVCRRLQTKAKTMFIKRSKLAFRHSPGARARAVRMVFVHPGSHETQADVIAAIVSKVGCIRKTLQERVQVSQTPGGRFGML